ncbi:MAG: DUF1275 domain-containing protein [Spirochaetes bacterium]|nr:DUF1275 domain-containing protein [Spirochaetota bacterium]
MGSEATLSPAHIRETRKVAFVTWASIFVMGYMNAYGLGTGNWLLGAMVTPQTGNFVWMGKNLADGNWPALFTNFMLFFGFAGGNIFGFYTKSITPNKTKQFLFSWTCFIIPVILFPITMSFVANTSVAFFVMGFAAGCGLSFFRQVFHLDINNAMATGSARFVGLWFWEACIKKAKTEKKEMLTFVLFFVCLFSFSAGAFLYTIVANTLFAGASLWILYSGELVLIIVCIIPYALAPRDPDFVKPRGEYGGGINKA